MGILDISFQILRPYLDVREPIAGSRVTSKIKKKMTFTLFCKNIQFSSYSTTTLQSLEEKFKINIYFPLDANFSAQILQTR